MQKVFTVVVAVLCFSFTQAQAPKTSSASDILQQMKKLEVFGSVLYIAAHPDDENTRLLAYLANERRLRTGYMSLTRGDGGQNLIGSEQGIDLGLIRTQELLAARRVDGAEQFFSTAFDFGYSKSPVETIEKWGHDKVLSDIVWVIRTFKPDVIITDPPRVGMHEKLVMKLLEIAAPRIVYVSCNTATLARDINLLSEKYTVEKIQPVDMFPHTHHIECVVLLRLK